MTSVQSIRENQRLEKKRIKIQKLKEREERKRIREAKKSQRDFIQSEKIKKKALRQKVREIQINPGNDLDHYYNELPDELIVDKMYNQKYVVVATNNTNELTALYKKSYNDDYALVYFDNGGIYMYPYAQMRKFISGYDKVTKYLKAVEMLLEKFDGSMYKALLYSKVRRKKK